MSLEVIVSNPVYVEYLQSEKWKTIREQRLAVDSWECVLCGEPAKHVHHRRYPKKLGTETVKDLVSLCSECHARHHNKAPTVDTEEIARVKRKLEWMASQIMKSVKLDIIDKMTMTPVCDEDADMARRALAGEPI